MESLEFLTVPRVVATVHQPEDLTFLAENDVSATCDLLEYRLDGLVDHLDLAEKSIATTPMPCIVTARHPDEGGTGHLDVASRSALLERFLPFAALVDIEIRSLGKMATIIESAREKEVALIASYHDFEKTPNAEELQQALNQSVAAKPDVTKIAFHLESVGALCEVIQFFEGFRTLDCLNPWRRLSLMGMGPLGKLSRLVFPSAGSCLNYGYLREANAPGQWPAAELKRLLGELGE